MNTGYNPLFGNTQATQHNIFTSFTDESTLKLNQTLYVKGGSPVRHHLSVGTSTTLNAE